MLYMLFLSFLAIIMRGQRTVRERSENTGSQPGPLGIALKKDYAVCLVGLVRCGIFLPASKGPND